MRLPCLLQFRILKLAIKSLFSRPYTTKFPAEPFEPIEQYRGRPRYDKDECIGCGACFNVCPAKCIDMIDDASSEPPMRRLIHHHDACIECGQCERYCTTEKGIKQTTEFDNVGFAPEDFEDKTENELLLCEDCGDVIAPIDQIRWLAKRLGPLAFANPTLMLVSHKELAVVDEGVKAKEGAPVRHGRISIQCPRCRRENALTI